MDQHPVPKNVLTVEFKLFGNLTVAQFMRILGSGILALIIYSLNINPLIAWPLIIVIVLTGVMSALVKDFEVRLFGLLRSMFVSPRYVWRKKEQVPDVLVEEKKASTKDIEAAKAAKNSSKLITDISLDRLLDARAASLSGSPTDDRGGSNFDRVYGQAYTPTGAPAATAPARVPDANKMTPPRGSLAGPTAQGQEVRLGPNTNMVVQPIKNTQPRPLTSAPTDEKSEIESDQLASLYEQEIQGLQDRLGELTKQNATPEQKQAVIDRINQLYAGIKQAATRHDTTVPTAAPKLDPKRMVYGIVVDKAGQPIPDTQVSVFTIQGEQVGPLAVSGADGRFAVESEFANGEYVVNLQHPKYQFLKFKIRVQADRLPAYRFREK